jgi:16S rRNA (guanine966-N2)-methyltransferase
VLRIIGGEKRGTQLFTPEGMDTRPLRDRVREALFNILQGRLVGRRVVDVFAGTGAVGLEALSRGAATGTFIESDARAARVIERNIVKLGYGTRARLVMGTVPACLRKAASPEGGFDLVFLMPPYHTGLGEVALAELTRSGALAPKAVAVLEVHRDEDTPPPTDWHVADDRHYGITRLVFLARDVKPD